MKVVVIYDQPSARSNRWVVREWEVRVGTLERPGSLTPYAAALTFKDLAGARRYIHRAFPGMHLVQEEGADPDPVVFEVYGG